MFADASAFAQETKAQTPQLFRKPIQAKPVSGTMPIAEPLLPRFRAPVVKPGPAKPQQHSNSVLPGGRKPAQIGDPGHYTMPIRNLSQLPHGRRVSGLPRTKSPVVDPFQPTSPAEGVAVPPATPDSYEPQQDDEQGLSVEEIQRRLQQLEPDPESQNPQTAAEDAGFLSEMNQASRNISKIRPFIGYALEYVEKKELPKRLAKPSSEPYVKPERAPIAFHWAASNLHHTPLYFEDPALERYGHTYHPLVQPFVSAGRMTTQLVGLPYQMAIDPPNRRVYTLGWIRPGDCAPKKIYQIPLNKKAALVEAAAIAGGFYIIP